MRNENMIQPQNPQCVQAVVTGCFSSVAENVIVDTGSDFSGVGAFDQALERLGIKQNKKFACDMDKYARQTYIYNFGEPDYYPENVYDREIPKESLDIYMTSPPCQSFSLAGKRKGEDSKNGVLFYNSHEFIVKNNPRYFIFENVKGLLSSKSCITYSNSLYLLLYNFKQIKEWEKLSYQKNNLNLLSQSITNYLCLNYAKKLGLKKSTSGMSYTTNSGLGYEKLETKVKSGLLRRLKFLEERIYQITTKSNYFQNVMTVPLECKEEDLVLNQNQSYLIENLLPMVTTLLEKTVDINVNTSLFANNILEDNSKKGKLYTILTELNSTINNQTFMYVLEKNIIRLIILALDLSPILWKEIWLILTGKKEFTGLKTFDIWLFNLDHLNYNVHHQVMNAKHYGVPQNRERIFIIGIRDDVDNTFTFPKPFHLIKRLKDVLESEVDEKYFLSDTMLNYFDSRASNFNNGNINFKDEESVASTITSSSKSLDISDNIIRLANVNPSGNGMNGNVYGDEGVSPTLSTNKGEGIKIGAIRGRNPTNPLSRVSGLPTEQMLEINENGTSNALTTVQKDNVVVIPAPIVEYQLTGGKWDKTHEQSGRVYDKNGIAPTIHTMGGGNQEPKVSNMQRIRRLTPFECFRLMDFNENFKWNVSDSQAYKQAGNSIVVSCLVEIIKRLDLRQPK